GGAMGHVGHVGCYGIAGGWGWCLCVRAAVGTTTASMCVLVGRLCVGFGSSVRRCWVLGWVWSRTPLLSSPRPSVPPWLGPAPSFCGGEGVMGCGPVGWSV